MTHRHLSPIVLSFLLFLLPIAQLTAQPCQTPYNEGRGPRSLWLNVQNCGTQCGEQFLPYLELIRNGLSGIRINPVGRPNAVAGNNSFYTVNNDDPLLRGVLRILGPDKLLVLVDDGVDDGPFSKPRPQDMERKLRSLFSTHPEVRRIQFMNEPGNFSDMSPEEYVAAYLPVARRVVDELNQSRSAADRIWIYSAGWFGNQEGFQETQRMVEAGGLGLVDVLGAHIYRQRTGDARDLAEDYKALARGKVVAITETNFNQSGSSRYNTQEWWICNAMTAMESVMLRNMPDTDRPLQLNVMYTMAGDKARNFNLITFPDPQQIFFEPTGPGHFVLVDRATVPTDPKDLPPLPGCRLDLGHPAFCRDPECGPCGVGQGDCDGDSECGPGLFCANNIGAQFGFSPNIDVCQEVEIERDCPWPAGHPRFCTDCGPCAIGEGDCDAGECLDGLVCVFDIGAQFGFSPNIDVCQQP